MDLTDTERYATAALFALALHSTHLEMGVDKNGNSLAESDIAWGCPSEELFDEHLLTQVPLQLPASLQEVFWGFDCMAPAGLAPRLFAWLKIPRKAWPGLLRMPDLAGNAGSPAAVEAFVALVRRYSAFLDSDLDFTTGQASRLQQHFSLPAATAAAAEAAEEQQQQQQQQQLPEGESGPQLTGSPAVAGTATGEAASAAADSSAAAMGDAANASAAAAEAASAAPAVRSSSAGGSSLLRALSLGKAGRSSSDDTEHAAAARKADAALASAVPAAEAMSAAAASITAAAVAASAGGAPPNSSSAGGAAAGRSSDAAAASSSPAAAPGEVPLAAADAAPGDAAAAAAAAAAAYEQQSGAVDQLPREAQEGTVVPAATFNPAESYSHTTSHKAVLALYEIIGGCIASNTEAVMEPLQAAAKQAEHAAAAAAAAAASRAQAAEAASARPGAAWFPAGENEAEEDDQTDGCQAAAGSGSSTAAAPKAGKDDSASSSSSHGHQLQQQQQQQRLQGLAVVQWYDSRARVAVKRVAHWLRVPWGQVRAFEQMWAMQALSLDPAAQPKYSSSSRAAAYLKVGAAAVGGGALLAVTGGLAAPAIAAGLGAAMSLAHGGAAAAAAVAGFAGSTAGTAAMTGLFGAWGASVGGGSAGQLYGEVKEFGFWDLSQSIYTDGKGPPKPAAAAAAAAAGEPAAGAAAAAGQEKQAPQDSPAAPKDATAAVPAAVVAAGGAASGSSSAEVSEQQQSSFLHRLFSSKSSASKQPGDAAAAGSGGVGGSSPQPASSAMGSPRPATPTAQQQQNSPMRQQQQSPQQVLGRKSPLSLFQWGGGKAAAAEEDEDDDLAEAEGPPPRVRSKYIELQQDAFNTDSDEDDEQFQAHYLTQQTTPQSTAAAAAAAAAATGSGPAAAVHKQQQPGQQQQQLEEPQLQPVRVTDDPLSRRQEPSSSGDESDADLPQQQQQQQQQRDNSTAAGGKDLQAGQTQAPVAAAGAGSPSAAAASQQQASTGMLGGLFGRKAAVVPVYVPLLPTPVNPKHQSETRIALTIAVNGCISCMEDYVEPWSSLPSRDCDRFVLVWESVCLKELGSAVGSFIAQQALTQVTQRTIQAFLYTGLIGALALPMTLSTAIKVAFGSKWLVALRRAQAAGKMLAMLLVQGCHGGRPVTLVGCSMGARLVFHCLLELARLGARGCVENVILLGAPLSCRPDRWCVARSVVAGRLINGFSVNDWTLGLLYRVHSSSSIWLQAAGIWKVEVPGVENVNLSRLIAGHTDYLTAMSDILEVINLQDS